MALLVRFKSLLVGVKDKRAASYRIVSPVCCLYMQLGIVACTNVISSPHFVNITIAMTPPR